MGFWFLQDPTVGPNATGGFDGKHVDGDVLIQSSLTNGGGVSDVHVFKWGNGQLNEVTGIDEGACTLGKLGTMNACAFANIATITRPWGPDLKSPYFYEGGLNLSALFPGQALPCFSTFISNTRTSQADSAVLKDFASGAIDTCGSIKIKKITDPAGATQTFNFTSDVTGHTAFQLTDGQTHTLDKLNTGTYHVGEGTPATGWSFVSVTCAVGDNLVQKSGANLTITLPPVGKVECTYLNARDTGSLKLSKVLTGGPAGYAGPFTIHYACDAAHTGDVSVNAGSSADDQRHPDGHAVHGQRDAADGSRRVTRSARRRSRRLRR